MRPSVMMYCERGIVRDGTALGDVLGVAAAAGAGLANSIVLRLVVVSVGLGVVVWGHCSGSQQQKEISQQIFHRVN